MFYVWIAVTLLAGWVAAWALGRRWKGVHLARLVLAAAASLVFVYAVARGAEPHYGNLFFLMLGIALFVRESIALRRGTPNPPIP